MSRSYVETMPRAKFVLMFKFIGDVLYEAFKLFYVYELKFNVGTYFVDAFMVEHILILIVEFKFC